MGCAKPLFPLGRILATPGAIDTLARANQCPQYFLNRHMRGDWGEIENEDEADGHLHGAQHEQLVHQRTRVTRRGLAVCAPGGSVVDRSSKSHVRAC